MSDAREWLIRKDGYYYRPNCSGYTTSKFEAGRYTKAEAEREAAVEPWHMKAIHQDDVEDDPVSSRVRMDSDRIASLQEQVEKLTRALSEQTDRDIAGIFPGTAKLREGAEPAWIGQREGEGTRFTKMQRVAEIWEAQGLTVTPLTVRYLRPAEQTDARSGVWVPGPDGWICEDEFTFEQEQFDAWVAEGLSPQPFFLSALSPAAPEGQPVTLIYKNWRGEVSERTIVPKRIWFGSTDWHPEPQWLVTAFDVEKQADRDFALRDFGAALSRPTERAVTEAWLDAALAEHERWDTGSSSRAGQPTEWHVIRKGDDGEWNHEASCETRAEQLALLERKAMFAALTAAFAQEGK